MSEIVAPDKPKANGKPKAKPQARPKPKRYDYDMVIIGSGPAGHRAAIQSAKLGKRVAVIEKKTLIGGVSVNTGTIPSKTLREAVLHLSGFRQRSIYGASYAVKQNITMSDLLLRADHVIRHEIEVSRHQLQRNGVQLFAGTATIVNEHTVHLSFVGTTGEDELTTRCIMIAVGTSVVKPADIPFDGEIIFTSDGLLKLDHLPKTLTVVGGGVIGCEYACMFATLGCRVTLVEVNERLLEFVDHEIVDALVYHMRQQRVTLRLGESIRSIEHWETRYGMGVKTRLASGKEIVTEKALYAIGRQGATRSLGLENVGIAPDKRGRIAVNEHYQTEIPSIYAVGDVVGFPQPGVHLYGAGADGGLPRLRQRASEHSRAIPLRHLRHPGDFHLWRQRRRADARRHPLRSGQSLLQGDRARADHRRHHRHAQAGFPPRESQAAGRAYHRRGRERADPHRADGDGFRRHGGLFHQHSLQLSHAGGVL